MSFDYYQNLALEDKIRKEVEEEFARIKRESVDFNACLAWQNPVVAVVKDMYDKGDDFTFTDFLCRMGKSVVTMIIKNSGTIKE